jgi:hypothetical protein
MTMTFHGRAKHSMTFIDVFFKKTFIYTMKIKFGVLDRFKNFKALAKNHIGKNIDVSCKENGIVK